MTFPHPTYYHFEIAYGCFYSILQITWVNKKEVLVGVRSMAIELQILTKYVWLKQLSQKMISLPY